MNDTLSPTRTPMPQRKIEFIHKLQLYLRRYDGLSI